MLLIDLVGNLNDVFHVIFVGILECNVYFLGYIVLFESL